MANLESCPIWKAAPLENSRSAEEFFAVMIVEPRATTAPTATGAPPGFFSSAIRTLPSVLTTTITPGSIFCGWFAAVCGEGDGSWAKRLATKKMKQNAAIPAGEYREGRRNPHFNTRVSPGDDFAMGGRIIFIGLIYR